MTGWIVLCCYLAGFVVAYRRLFVAVLDSVPGPLDAVDRVLLAALAAVIAAIWPILVPFALVYHLATPTTPRELERALEEREREIARIERELHIGRNTLTREEPLD